jgi:hypothetical protein
MALITNVNIPVTGNAYNGTATSTFQSPFDVRKSYAYDEAQYTQTDPVTLQIGGQANWAAGTQTANTGGSLASASIVAFTNKQVRSITVVPTVAETANDFIQLDLYSLAPQVFGTATATACLGGTAAVAATGWFGTVMGTGVNRVRICGIIGAGGTGVGGATGTQAFGIGTAVAYNPTYVNLAGATATIIVVAPVGTNTQAGYVFPTGPLGGLTMNPGDVLTVTRGTSSIGVYQAELECTFSPGGNVTR